MDLKDGFEPTPPRVWSVLIPMCSNHPWLKGDGDFSCCNVSICVLNTWIRNFSGFAKGFGSSNKHVHPFLPSLNSFLWSFIKGERAFLDFCHETSLPLFQHSPEEFPADSKPAEHPKSPLIPCYSSPECLLVWNKALHSSFFLFNFLTSSFSSRILSVNTKKLWLSCLIYPSPHLDFISWSQFQVLMLHSWFKCLIYPPSPPPLLHGTGLKC